MISVGMRLNLAWGLIGLALLGWSAAAAGVLAGHALVGRWLYHLAWWPLLFFLDGVWCLRTGESWFWDRPRQFLRLCGRSVTLWLVFEMLNLFLLNWRYVGLEPRVWLRWPGYAAAFATVLPAILLSARLVEILGVGPVRRANPWQLPHWQPLFLILGVACLALPLVVPTYAFPLVWLAFFLLGDPLLDLLGQESLTARLLARDRREVCALLAAGLALGLWWELWNYPASAKWIYTLPWLNFGKIFEMPVLGYLGFPFFALECAVLHRLAEFLSGRLLTTPGRRGWAWLGQVAFWLAAFAAIDGRTVLSFAVR